jgi:hypothetical protein
MALDIVEMLRAFSPRRSAICASPIRRARVAGPSVGIKLVGLLLRQHCYTRMVDETLRQAGAVHVEARAKELGELHDQWIPF